MSDEDYYDHLRMIRYFYQEKGDVTRYSGWDELKPELKKRRPDIYMIIMNALQAEEALASALENL